MTTTKKTSLRATTTAKKYKRWSPTPSSTSSVTTTPRPEMLSSAALVPLVPLVCATPPPQLDELNVSLAISDVMTVPGTQSPSSSAEYNYCSTPSHHLTLPNCGCVFVEGDGATWRRDPYAMKIVTEDMDLATKTNNTILDTTVDSESGASDTPTTVYHYQQLSSPVTSVSHTDDVSSDVMSSPADDDDEIPVCPPSSPTDTACPPVYDDTSVQRFIDCVNDACASIVNGTYVMLPGTPIWRMTIRLGPNDIANPRKCDYYLPICLPINTMVTVEADGGIDVGQVTNFCLLAPNQPVAPARLILRVSTPDDFSKAARANVTRGDVALAINDIIAFGGRYRYLEQFRLLSVDVQAGGDTCYVNYATTTENDVRYGEMVSILHVRFGMRFWFYRILE